MGMRSFRYFWSILLVCFILPVVGAEALALSNPILTEARHILSVAKESHYHHTTHVDEDAGVYDFDCSGLLCFILKQDAPEHLKAVPAAPHHARPLALQFYDFFTAAGEKGNRGWRQITRVKDALPGDVLAWRKAEQIPGKDTGHVMIVDEAPVEDGSNTYRIVVIDSTESPHGNDTRKDGASGIGRGTMWFVADSDGKPVAYHWKLRDGKVHEIQIAIGRAIMP
jgi:hypothetical protein